MTPLVRKELRSMVPFIALVLFINAMNLVDEIIEHQPDMRPLARTLHEYVAPDDFAVILFLLVFALGSGLLVREHDEGTMEFLDSLPVSRSRVFWTKVGLASLVLWTLPLTNVVLAAVLHGWAHTSLDPSFHWQVLLTSLFLYACMTIVFLSLALSLSFLRRFGWLVVALLFWVYVLARRFFPGVAILNALELVTPHFKGQQWILPVDLLMVQMPLAAGLIAVAYFVFVGAGDRLIRGYNRMSQSRVGAGVLIATGIAVGVLLFAMIGYLSYNDAARSGGEREDMVRAEYASWATARSTSRYYSFVYPANLSDRARGVIARADDVHEAVGKFLGASLVDIKDGTRIAVDMTGAAPRHSGDAYWNTIRMNLTGNDETGRLVAVFGHETTHVYIDRLSDSRLTDTFNSTRFFHEGLATYLEHRLFGSAESVKPQRSVAAVMRQRREVEFEELVDDDLLRSKRDTNLVYPLGEVFVAGLTDRYGDAAPGRLLRAFARKDRPKGLHGMALWQDSFQSAGFSLDAAVDAFFARLDALVVENRAFIASLPRPRGAVRYKGSQIGVDPVWTPLEGWNVVCRFRQFADSNERDYLNGYRKDEDAFWIERKLFPAATFWYQVGIHEAAGERTIWEPWREARLRP